MSTNTNLLSEAGFSIGNKGCCGTGIIEVAFLCKYTCSNVADYIFWDSFHLTEKAYRVLVQQFLKQHLNSFIWADSLCWFSHVLSTSTVRHPHIFLRLMIYYDWQTNTTIYGSSNFKVHKLVKTCLQNNSFSCDFVFVMWDTRSLDHFCIIHPYRANISIGSLNNWHSPSSL